ncbi:MAG: type II toxin-antitoxin system HicB family antitoxin [Anaerolineales bacterium]
MTTMTNDYHINIFFSVEDEAYIADIPDLKFCSAHGETPEEALAEVLIAKQAWLEAAHENGRPIPKPRYRPAIYQAY